VVSEKKTPSKKVILRKILKKAQVLSIYQDLKINSREKAKLAKVFRLRGALRMKNYRRGRKIICNRILRSL